MEILKSMVGNYTLDIWTDVSPENPREGFNYGKIIIRSEKFNLNETDFSLDKDFRRLRIISKRKNDSDYIVFPIYAYIRNTISLYLSRPKGSDMFDTPIIGFVIVDKRDFKKRFGLFKNESNIIVNEMAAREIKKEIDDFTKYLNGDVYGYTLKLNGEVIDHCGGFYGDITPFDIANSISIGLANMLIKALQKP